MVCLEVIVKNVTMNLQSDGCSKTHVIISIQKLIKNYLLTHNVIYILILTHCAVRGLKYNTNAVKTFRYYYANHAITANVL